MHVHKRIEVSIIPLSLSSSGSNVHPWLSKCRWRLIMSGKKHFSMPHVRSMIEKIQYATVSFSPKDATIATKATMATRYV